MTTAERIAIIRDFVPRLRALIAPFNATELVTAYNAPEWTIAQNVHHLVDSHVNAYIRFKLLLSEENATVRPYDQDAFASLPDANLPELEDSLLILQGLHARWALLLDHIQDWGKQGYHPDNGVITLDSLLTTYANHCNAHIRQIQEVIAKMPRHS